MSGSANDNEPGRGQVADTSDHAKHLIQLVVNQDQVTQNWIRFLITVEAGLAVGLGFILQLSDDEQPLQWFAPVVSILIPLLGCAVGVIVCLIVRRERRWASWFVQRFNALPGYAGKVFPTTQAEVRKQQAGFMSTAVFFLAALIVLAWLLVGYALWSRTQPNGQEPTAPVQPEVEAAADSRLMRNEGNLVGSALAGVVAVFSVITTHALEKRRQRERSRRTYVSLLHSMHVEIVWHTGVSRRLREHLEVLREIAEERAELPVNDLGEEFELAFFEACRQQLLAQREIDTLLMRLLAEYANFTRFVNRSIQLSAVHHVLQHFGEFEERRDGLIQYVDSILTELDKRDGAVPVIERRIRAELESLPGVEVIGDSGEEPEPA